MELKIKIKTAKGYAASTEKKLRPFILKSKSPSSIYISDDDDTIFWHIEGDIRDMLRIENNVNRFDMVFKAALQQVSRRKVVTKRLSKDGLKELMDLSHDTTVEIVKRASAQEIIDSVSRETYWEWIKRKFKKVK